MIDLNKGGSAFPYTVANGAKSVDPGMTLRDYFAAKAMQALMSRPEHAHFAGSAHYAQASYVMADAMLKARES
jgi:hypothetical protein